MDTTAKIAASAVLFRGEYSVKQREFEKSLREQLLQRGFQSFQDVKENCCVFDFSESYWFDLGCLLWLISLLHVLRKQDNELQLIFPEPKDSTAKNLWHFLIRWRFFETLTKCVDDPVNLLKPHQLPYTRLLGKYGLAEGKDEHGKDAFLHTLKLLEITTIRADSEEKGAPEAGLEGFLARYHADVAEKALRQLCGWDEVVATAFRQRILREGIRNSILHAQGSFATIALRVDRSNLTLAIADNGIGIPETLRRAFRESGVRTELVEKSDVDLIKFFTEPEMIVDSRFIRLSVEKGITSRPGHAGEGLFYLKSLVLSQGGELRIRSGKACVDFTSAKATPYDDMVASPGTVIRIITPLKSH